MRCFVCVTKLCADLGLNRECRSYSEHGGCLNGSASQIMCRLQVYCDGHNGLKYVDHERSCAVCVAGNDIGSEGAASLAPALREMKQLQHLDLACKHCWPYGSWCTACMA